MPRLIKYTYRNYTLGCQCCSDSESYYDLYDNGVLMREEICCEVASDEVELRDILGHLEPFDIDPDSEWL